MVLPAERPFNDPHHNCVHRDADGVQSVWRDNAGACKQWPLLIGGRFFYQGVHLAPVSQMPGCNFGIGAVSPEYIGSSGSAYGAAGVLADDKSLEGLPVVDHPVGVYNRFGGFDKHQGGKRKYPVIDSDRSSRCELDIQITQGPVGFGFKENIAGIII